MDEATSNTKVVHHFTFGVQHFYGKKVSDKEELSKKDNELKFRNEVSLFRKWPRQLDLAATWKVFKKQQDVLEYVHVKKGGLMAFAFQDKFGHRLFLAAHPTVFWFYDSKRKLQDRCSYEIITEHSVCKLYFDLEFNKELNSQHDGNRMTESFIKIVSYFIKKEWDLVISREHILDLDSTTREKFSRHLVYIVPNVAFQDNYNVGNFVKYVCSKIREYINDSQRKDTFCDVKETDVCSLLITDKKGSSKLFCDEGVYTKNRHFRLYMSTKQNKTAPLTVGNSNLYKPSKINKLFIGNLEEQIFLDSLITYFNNSIDNFRVLKFSPHSDTEQNVSTSSKRPREIMSSSNIKSPYPVIDKFISDLVSPGRIWRWLYFSSGSVLVYDIIGYRYCGNIGREHRSNNIKYVVQLETLSYYQKCYDPDCSNFRSVACKLPPEVTFFLEDDSVFAVEGEQSFSATMGYFGILEEEFVQVVDAVECIENDISVSSEVPDYGISDNDMSLLLDDIKSDL